MGPDLRADPPGLYIYSYDFYDTNIYLFDAHGVERSQSPTAHSATVKDSVGAAIGFKMIQVLLTPNCHNAEKRANLAAVGSRACADVYTRNLCASRTRLSK